MKPRFDISLSIVASVAVFGFMIYNVFWGDETTKYAVISTLLIFATGFIIAGILHGLLLWFHNKKRGK